MSWFKNKEVIEDYTPKGRIGYKRFNTIGKSFVVIVEKLLTIGARSKIRLLEISIDRDSYINERRCLRMWGDSDWVLTDNYHWESDAEMTFRLNEEQPQTFTVPPKKEKIKYNITPLNFTEND